MENCQRNSMPCSFSKKGLWVLSYALLAKTTVEVAWLNPREAFANPDVELYWRSNKKGSEVINPDLGIQI